MGDLLSFPGTNTPQPAFGKLSNAEKLTKLSKPNWVDLSSYCTLSIDSHWEHLRISKSHEFGDRAVESETWHDEMKILHLLLAHNNAEYSEGMGSVKIKLPQPVSEFHRTTLQMFPGVRLEVLSTPSLVVSIPNSEGGMSEAIYRFAYYLQKSGVAHVLHEGGQANNRKAHAIRIFLGS